MIHHLQHSFCRRKLVSAWMQEQDETPLEQLLYAYLSLVFSIEILNGHLFQVLYFAPLPLRYLSDRHAAWYGQAYLIWTEYFVHIMNIWWQDAQSNNNKKGRKEEEKEKQRAVKSFACLLLLWLRIFFLQSVHLGKLFLM